MNKRKPETVADALRRHIAESGLSLNALGRESGVDPGALSRYMRNERDMGVQSASRIAAALGLKLVKE